MLNIKIFHFISCLMQGGFFYKFFRLLDPAPLWHTFPRQKQAFDFAASHPEVKVAFTNENYENF